MNSKIGIEIFVYDIRIIRIIREKIRLNSPVLKAMPCIVYQSQNFSSTLTLSLSLLLKQKSGSGREFK